MASLNIFNVFQASGQGAFLHIFRFLAFPWGYVNILVNSVNISLLSFFGAPLTEFTLFFPFVVLGSASIFLVYLVGKEIMNEKAALIASAIFAFMPFQIMHSVRNLNLVPPAFLFLLTIYFLTKHFKNRDSKKFALLSAFSLAMYFSSDNVFLIMFPALFFLGFFFSTGRDLASRIRGIFNRRFIGIIILTLVLLLPLLLVQAYFVFTGNLTQGFWGHLFEGKAKPGFFLLGFLYLFSSYSGIVFTLFLLPAVIFALKEFKSREKDFFLALFLVSSFIWVFVVPNTQTIVRNYMYHSAIAAAFLVGFFLERIDSHFVLKKRFYWTAPALVALIVSFALFGGFLGLVGTVLDKNTGVKTAGYYARENIAQGEAVFTDQDPTIARYYFHLDTLAVYDSHSADLWGYFDSVKEKTSFIIVEAKNREEAENRMGSAFSKTAEIFYGGKPVMFIYSKEKLPLRRMNSEDFDKLFDKKYGKIESLLTEKIWETASNQEIR